MRRAFFVFLAVGVVSLPAIALGAETMRFRGTGEFRDSLKGGRDKTDSAINGKIQGNTLMSMRISSGTIHFGMKRPDEVWHQSFVVTSDKIVGGKRTIAFSRPSASSPLAKANLRDRNGPAWKSLFGLVGAHLSLEGQGTFEIESGRAKFQQTGEGTIRLFHKRFETSFNETFEGVEVFE